MSDRLAPPGDFAEDKAVRGLAEERSRINSECYRAAGMRRSHADLARFLRRLAKRPGQIRDGRFYGMDLDVEIRNLFDHIRLYNRHGRPYAAIFHPYSRLDRESMEALTHWAWEAGLNVSVDADSEYYPGVTLRLVLYREDEEFPATDLA